MQKGAVQYRALECSCSKHVRACACSCSKLLSGGREYVGRQCGVEVGVVVRIADSQRNQVRKHRQSSQKVGRATSLYSPGQTHSHSVMSRTPRAHLTTMSRYGSAALGQYKYISLSVENSPAAARAGGADVVVRKSESPGLSSEDLDFGSYLIYSHPYRNPTGSAPPKRQVSASEIFSLCTFAQVSLPTWRAHHIHGRPGEQ